MVRKISAWNVYEEKWMKLHEHGCGHEEHDELKHEGAGGIRMKRLRVQPSVKRRGAKNPTDAPSGRQTMLPGTGPATVGAGKIPKSGRSTKGEKASPEKWSRVSRRAGEVAMNEGKRPEEIQERHVRRAKRELLGLQTLPDPDNPLAQSKPRTGSSENQES
jgi:hypothetical protein